MYLHSGQMQSMFLTGPHALSFGSDDESQSTDHFSQAKIRKNSRQITVTKSQRSFSLQRDDIRLKKQEKRLVDDGKHQEFPDYNSNLFDFKVTALAPLPPVCEFCKLLDEALHHSEYNHSATCKAVLLG